MKTKYITHTQSGGAETFCNYDCMSDALLGAFVISPKIFGPAFITLMSDFINKKIKNENEDIENLAFTLYRIGRFSPEVCIYKIEYDNGNVVTINNMPASVVMEKLAPAIDARVKFLVAFSGE